MTKVKTETAKTAAGLASLVRVLPAAKGTAGSLKSPLARATTGARRLDVWSKRPDASLASATKQVVTAAASALDARRTSGG